MMCSGRLFVLRGRRELLQAEEEWEDRQLASKAHQAERWARKAVSD
jgi:hypothetical protein